jgi:hypothetical protein
MRRQDRERIGGSPKDSASPQQHPERPEEEKVRGSATPDEPQKPPHEQRQPGRMPLPE